MGAIDMRNMDELVTMIQDVMGYALEYTKQQEDHIGMRNCLEVIDWFKGAKDDGSLDPKAEAK